MTLVDALPSKLQCDKLLIPLGKSILTISKPSKDNISLLDGIVASGRLSSDARARLIQSAVNQVLSQHGKGHDIFANWLQAWSKGHPEEFRTCVAPMLDLLGSDKVESLEKLTQMSLKVRNLSKTHLTSRPRSQKPW
jgi:hypothetical protein